ncbi:MAG: hypothetical protein ABIW18_01910 [Sphingomicrobium sp.]
MAIRKTSKGGSRPPKGPRRPHNAGKRRSFRSLGDLARAIGAEPKRATLRGKEVVMSQAERLCRLIVEKAINGSVSDLKLLIRTMVDHPQIAASATDRWVMFLAGNDAEL